MDDATAQAPQEQTAPVTPRPRLSVVIATKDRPQTLRRLLGCVKQQTLQEIEVIVADDGSAREVVEAYSEIWSGLDERFQLHLNRAGGGPGGSRNKGIRLARGEFVAFCDDDDIWVREDHLQTAVAALSQFDGDLYVANMQTSINGAVHNRDWHGKAGQILKRLPLNPERTLFEVRPTDLARFLEQRILPANTLVVRRGLLTDIGLYWDRIAFAEDHDLSFRLADASRKTLYCSSVAADADVGWHPSVARRYDPEDRLFFDIIATMHAEYCVRSPRLRRAARRNRAGRIVELSKLLLVQGRKQQAFGFALQGVMTSPHPGTWRHLCRVLAQMCWPRTS